MLKVIAKLKKMSITMPDDDHPYGVITGTFQCPATEDNMVQLHQMSGHDFMAFDQNDAIILLNEVQPTLSEGGEE